MRSFQKTAVAVLASLALFLKTAFVVVLKLTTAVAVLASLAVFFQSTLAVLMRLF